MRKTSAVVEELVVKEYTAGAPLRSIAARYGISTKTVSDIRRRNGVDPRPRGGSNHYRWAGGRTMTPKGYVDVWVSPGDELGEAMMNKTNRNVREHRLVMARSLGRPLHSHETVHHLNGNRADNRLENLQLRTGPHGPGQALRCRCCGSSDIEAITIQEVQK